MMHFRPEGGKDTVYATEIRTCLRLADKELSMSDGFAVVKVCGQTGVIDIKRGYETIEAAEVAAIEEAKSRNAVFIPSSKGGQR